MHKIGSDTIIASSTELKRSSRDGLRESALFKDFATKLRLKQRIIGTILGVLIG